MYIIQVIAGLLTARTIIVGFGISLFYLLIAPKEYRKRKWFAIGLIASSAAIISLALIIFFQDFIEKYMGTIQWTFRLVISIMDGGKTRVGSLDILFGRMYFFPESVRTLLIGDGLIVNNDGSFYMHTDAGYMRYLLFFGMLGLISFIVFQCYLGLSMFGKHNNQLLKNMAYILIIYVLIAFIKFRANICHVASLFFCMNYIVLPRSCRHSSKLIYK
jgi:hypothetical protein